MVGFKRVYNIAKAVTDEAPVDTALFEHKEEEDLWNLFQSKKGGFAAEMAARRYPDVIAMLVGFKETIDAYFDKVFVMADNEVIKNNRLRMLARIKEMFLQFGDFSKIRVEELGS
jgi:glycyl-tRNA synthetase beta chain